MRLGLVISWAVVLPAIVTAQQMIPGAEIPLTPPAYKMLRFDEDYSSLTNPANRTDLVDPVKYIPLRQDHPLWYRSRVITIRHQIQPHSRQTLHFPILTHLMTKPTASAWPDLTNTTASPPLLRCEWE
jgi:hypothetical protein